MATQSEIDAVCDLIRAAMESKEHVFVEWAPHVEKVYVRASPTTTDYQDVETREYLIDEGVYLGGDEVFGQADSVEALNRLRQAVLELGG